MMKLNSNVACIEYKNKVILANKLTGMWLRITKEIYNYFIKALELNYERKDFVRSFMREEDQIYIGKLLDKMEEIGILGDAEFFFQKSVAFEITNRCNLTCMHCCFSAGKQGEEMTTQRVTEILQKIIKWQPDKITITGGEPLLRNDLLEHLKFLREAFEGIIILATNGTLIHKGNVSDIIQYIDRIDISVDGVDEESSRKIRGRGVFAKVLKSVELLKLNGFDSISLSMVLTEDNEKLEEQFLDLNRKLGTFPVLRRISWIGRALENQKQLTSSGVLYEHGAEIKKDEKCMCTYGNCQNLVSKYHIRYWFVENNDSILNEMYQVIGQYFEKRFSDKQICDIELLTRTGPLKMEMVIPFLEYVKKTMDIKIDYLKVNRYHLLTVGTLVKYIKSL